MFKLVLCVFLAAATADPSGSFYAQPLTYSSTVISPAVTTISKSASSVVHPSPTYYYSTPSVYSHFIKKRGAPFYFPTTYAAGSPLLSYSSPILHGAPLLTSAPLLSSPIAAAPYGYATAAHLIKKRSASAPILATTAYGAYSPLTYSAPWIAPTPLISAAPLYHSPILSHAPLGIPHLIKKRSTVFASAIPVATSFSHQSRIDLRTPYVSHYPTPLAYHSPYAYSHVY